eukprot:Rhum_TRINITY_DN12721_c0_g3::Rhum_TRINITY_DN12721_c0_g3_i1::g.53987::m.53987
MVAAAGRAFTLSAARTMAAAAPVRIVPFTPERQEEAAELFRSGLVQGIHPAVDRLMANFAAMKLDPEKGDIGDITRAFSRDPHSSFWLAYDGSSGDLVGQVGAHGCEDNPDYTSDCTELVRLTVVPSARGRGIAERLLEVVDAFAAERGSAHVTLSTLNYMRPACTFYEKHGFTRTKEEEFPEGAVEKILGDDAATVPADLRITHFSRPVRASRGGSSA